MANEKNINSRIQQKHDIEANWLKAENFVPKAGEIIVYDADENHSTPRFKIGDGVNNVNLLSFTSAINIQDSDGTNSIAQTNAAAVGENSAAFGVSELQTNENGTIKTEVKVIVGYDPKKGDVITKTYGTSGSGSGSTGDLTPEEEPTEESVMYYKDGNQILSVFSIEFDSTGSLGENSFTAGENTLAAAKNSNATGWNTYAGANYASTEGSDTIVLGEDAHAEGLKNMSIGQASHTEGMRNTAEGKNSHLEGLKNHTSTNAVNSHVEGSYNNCRSSNTHIEGMWNVAIGSAAHAHIEGEVNITNAINSHAEGYGNKIEGSVTSEADGKTYYAQEAHVEGRNNTIQVNCIDNRGAYAHVEGISNITSGDASHLEGFDNTSNANYSHIEGMGNIIKGNAWDTSNDDQVIYTALASHIEGQYNIIDGGETGCDEWAAHVEGMYNKSISSPGSHIEGKSNIATGARYSHIEGRDNTVNEECGHAEGSSNIVNGLNAHVGGTNSVANGANSFVHGNRSKAWTAGGIAIGTNQFSRQNSAVSIGHSAQYVEDLKDADGNKITVDTNDNVHSVYTAFTSLAEGNRFSAAIGPGAVSLGNSNVAHKGVALGYENYANGTKTHFGVAIGSSNIAQGQDTVAIGKGNKVTVANQQAYGVYNKTNNNAIYMVGHGTVSTPSNAFIIDTNDNGRYRGSLYVNADSTGNGGKLVATVEYVDNKFSGSGAISTEYIKSLFSV